MKPNDNTKVQNPIYTNQAKICKSLFLKQLRYNVIVVVPVENRAMLVTHWHKKTCNRKNPDFPLSDPSTFSPGIPVGIPINSPPLPPDFQPPNIVRKSPPADTILRRESVPPNSQ